MVLLRTGSIPVYAYYCKRVCRSYTHFTVKNKPLINKIRIFFLIFGNHKVLCVGATPIIRPPLKYTNIPYSWTGREYQEKENMRMVFRA